MDEELKALVRGSLRQALAGSPKNVGAALDEFGWREFVDTDEAFAFTALFEEQGYLAADTNALDVAVSAVLRLDGNFPAIWPLGRSSSGGEIGGSGELFVDGVALRGGFGACATVLAPVGGRMHMVSLSSIEEAPLGGMASGSAGVYVRGWGTHIADLGPWPDVERRGLLAIASELVGVTHRIVDVATAQVSTRRQFGRPIGANQSVRFRLAEAYVEMVGARALIAAAWADGSPASARWAKTVAGTAHDAAAKHAMQVCGAIGLSEEHPLPGLVRRGLVLDALLGSGWPEIARIGQDLFAAQRDSDIPSELAAAAVGRF